MVVKFNVYGDDENKTLDILPFSLFFENMDYQRLASKQTVFIIIPKINQVKIQR